ncbi:MAG: hypothetical protein IT373_08840 [Polyangiaceae bacterium]|nr:hypothetical protein [Polyangiaceae bacterium]
MKKSFWIYGLAALGLTVSAFGCNPYGSFCESQESCRGGNDKDIDACTEEIAAEADIGSAYGCDAEWDALWECAEADAYCNNSNWTYSDKCQSKEQSYNQCKHDASGIK